MWLGAIIASFRRKQAIGGWLFFFFWQVASGCTVSIASTEWSQYSPSAWHDSFKYLIFTMVTMPRFAILIVIAGIGATLLRSHDWRWVVVMRYALILYSILGMLSVGADALYFPDRLTADVATLIFPLAYTIYFYVSSRVKSVFLDRVWDQHVPGVSST